MGLVVRALTRKNIIAIVVGVLLAGAPLIAFNFWLGGLIERQGQEEVDTSAKRAIALAESRVTQVIAALDGLATRGVDGCQPDDVTAMRQAAFDTVPIKEIAIFGPGGQTLCTDLGLPPGQRKVIWSEPLAGADRYSLELIQLDNGQPDGALQPRSRRRPEWNCGAGAGFAVPAASVHPRRAVQRVCANRNRVGRVDRKYGRTRRRHQRYIRDREEIRQIRIHNRNFDVARSV